MRLPLVAAALLALAGCYSHAPIELGAAPVGARVRARVTPNQAERLAELLGRDDRMLGGRVVGMEDGSLLLQVPIGAASGAERLEQRVLLPPAEIERLELRRIDRRRTAGLVAALAAVGGIVAYTQLDTDPQDGGRTDPPPINEIRIPLGWLFR